ncbi:MAG: hypothetical protein IPG23_11700 [Burkholderiales bacterium]|nr:hypothetical protein [Burkholderiales bacterium]
MNLANQAADWWTGRNAATFGNNINAQVFALQVIQLNREPSTSAANIDQETAIRPPQASQ